MTRTLTNRPNRRRIHLALAASAALLPLARANAIDITLEYDPTADDAVECCDGWDCCDPGEDRVADLGLIMAAAAAHWEDIYEDDHDIHVRYWFSDRAKPAANVTEIDGLGRPTEAYIRIPASFNWYYDPDPFSGDEFTMSPKLYRTMLPVEQAEAFDGVPPEILEVGYNGPGPGTDLYYAVLHEFGHVLGLEEDIIGGHRSPPCDEQSDPYFYPPGHLTGGNFGIKAFEGGDGFDCQHLAAGGIVACNGEDEEEWCKRHQALMWPAPNPGARATPSLLDIMAIAEAAGWQEVDYPRKYTLGSGEWNAPGAWMGDRVPDANDDVYIVNAPNATIQLFGGGVARNVFLTDDNTLRIFFSTLDVGGTVKLEHAGTFLDIDSAATLEASTLWIKRDTEMHLGFADSLADVFYADNWGEISGAGELHVSSIDNQGEIEASGGTLRVLATNSLDLDGGEGVTARLEAVMGDLILEGPIPDPVRADVVVGSGRSVWFVDGWTQQSITVELLLQGGADPAEVLGESTIQGRVTVENEGRFSSNVYFQPQARVTLADADAELTFGALTEYRGGSFTGPGRMIEMGGVRVVDDTTIGPIEVYDMDGAQNTNVAILPDVTFTIDAFRIDAVLGDGYDGTLSLDGTLVVNTDDAWRLDGTLLMNLTGGTHAFIDGTEFEHRGGMSVLETGTILTTVYITENAFIHTIDSDARIELASAEGNDISGGRITGDGTLHVSAPSDLRGFGLIETDVEAAGEIRGQDGWLTLEGAITELTTIGAIGEGAGLFVQDAWSTLDGVLNVQQAASIGGGDITNTGATTGHGFFFVDQFLNDGRVGPGSSPNGDGSDGTGVLALFGDYEQSENGRLELAIGGLALGEYDGVAIGEHAQLAGDLELALAGGFVPEIGDRVTIMTWTTQAGAFDSVAGLELPGGLMWQLAYLPDRLELTVVEGCEGDVDGSGEVDFSDLIELLAAWGPCPEDPEPCPEDLDDNDVVDFSDLLLLIGNWGSCD